MGGLSVPALAVGNSAIAAAAGIEASKLQHQHQPVFAQPNTTATSETRALHVCYGATGTVIAFRAGSIAINAGAATVTVDIKKNGTSILSAPITLNSSNTNRVVAAGTISTPGLVAGDLLEVVTVATAGGGTLATGVYAQAIITEAAQ